MGAVKIKLVRSLAGRSDDHKRIVSGLGLWRMGQERLLEDTPAIRGMVAKVHHMVSLESVGGEAPKRRRTRSVASKAAKK